MGKSTHFFGQPMYNQLLKLLDKSEILKSAEKTAVNATQNDLMGGFIWWLCCMPSSNDLTPCVR